MNLTMSEPAASVLLPNQHQPRLRQRPIPQCEPYPAQRVDLDDFPVAPSNQGVLPLQLLPSNEQVSPWWKLQSALHSPTTELPEPDQWVRQFVQAALEVAAGRRPAAQVARWASEAVHRALARRGDLARNKCLPSLRYVVRSVHISAPRAGIVEACTVVNDSHRARAVALRMQTRHGRWCVTALEIV